MYLGDTGSYLAEIAKKRCPSASLITKTNYQNLGPGTYWTSLGYLDDLTQFASILRQCHEIVYSPPDTWSDTKMRDWTLDYLEVLETDQTKKILGVTASPSPLSYRNQKIRSERASDSKQIWVAGCSISHGLGVAPHQRYGEIISSRLNLPVTYLTQPASSILWAADQILRSDIRAGDSIFWGLTSSSRISYWHDIEQKVMHCVIHNYHNHKNFLNHIITENFLASDHVKYQSVLAVDQVNNFCRKVNANLVIATLYQGMELFLRELDNFVPLAGLHGRELHNMFVDIGTDGRHPGVAAHQFYADHMLAKHKQLYEFKN